VDSNIPNGKLEPGASTNFPAIVPDTKGTPFRVSVAYSFQPRALDRLRAKLPNSIPGLDLIWPIEGPYIFTSQWFRAPADYSSTK
jgi:hypothetical protein